MFKGDNLLWHYIKTPRQTIDLDLTTVKLDSHLQVKKVLAKIETYYSEIKFTVKEFTELNKRSHTGAKAIIGYKSASGQINQFSLDIVYALPTDLVKIKSTTSDGQYKSASIENIINDKKNAIQRFGSGNTRMKDFDDLWRISKSNITINTSKLCKLMKERENDFSINSDWVEYLEDQWKRHSKSYEDLPKALEIIFSDINSWLSKLEKA